MSIKKTSLKCVENKFFFVFLMPGLKVKNPPENKDSNKKRKI